uniref:PH domain-containing protein n=1 Tax=Lotharella globosa TaxID=91324 RepID=A0A7S4DL50_9EUKA
MKRDASRELDFARQGYMWVRRQGISQQWERRWFVLSNGWLRSYGGPEKLDESESDRISLENSHLESLPYNMRAQGRYYFKLHAPNSKRILMLACNTSDEFQEWARYLTGSIKTDTYNSFDFSGDDSHPATPGATDFSRWIEETRKRGIRRTTEVKSDRNPRQHVVHTYYGVSAFEEQDMNATERHEAELQPLITESGCAKRRGYLMYCTRYWSNCWDLFTYVITCCRRKTSAKKPDPLALGSGL